MVPECESLRVSLRLIWFPDRLPWKYVVEFGLDIGSRFERLTRGLGNQFAKICITVSQYQPNIGEFFRCCSPSDGIIDFIKQGRNVTELNFTSHMVDYVREGNK